MIFFFNNQLDWVHKIKPQRSNIMLTVQTFLPNCIETDNITSNLQKTKNGLFYSPNWYKKITLKVLAI